MKVIGLTTCLLLLSLLSFAQLLYLSAGSNLSFTNCAPLDFVVQRYNDTRTYLSDPMDEFDNISGVGITAGMLTEDGLLFEMRWAGRNQVVSAQGIPAGETLQERDLKLRANSYGIGIGYAMPKGNFRPGLDASIDFGAVKTYTRTGQASEVSGTGYDEITNEINIGATMAGNIFILFNKDQTWGILLKPYYQYYFSKNDFSELNAAINPNTAIDDDPEAQVGKLNNYGVMMLLVLGGK